GLSPAEITLWKGLGAGSTNLLIGACFGRLDLHSRTVPAALVVGALSYGASIVLYIGAAREIGAARAQAVVASAPFVGALLSFVLLQEPLGLPVLAAGLFFAFGATLSLLDRHEHEHTHEACVHSHAHRHDDGHHDHEHEGLPPGTLHTHVHAHG